MWLIVFFCLLIFAVTAISMKITTKQEVLRRGDTLSLDCRAGSSNPKSNISWTVGSQRCVETNTHRQDESDDYPLKCVCLQDCLLWFDSCVDSISWMGSLLGSLERSSPPRTLSMVGFQCSALYLFIWVHSITTRESSVRPTALCWPREPARSTSSTFSVRKQCLGSPVLCFHVWVYVCLVLSFSLCICLSVFLSVFISFFSFFRLHLFFLFVFCSVFLLFSYCCVILFHIVLSFVFLLFFLLFSSLSVSWLVVCIYFKRCIMVIYKAADSCCTLAPNCWWIVCFFFFCSEETFVVISSLRCTLQ